MRARSRGARCFSFFFAGMPACIWVQGTAVIRLGDALFHDFFHLYVTWLEKELLMSAVQVVWFRRLNWHKKQQSGLGCMLCCLISPYQFKASFITDNFNVQIVAFGLSANCRSHYNLPSHAYSHATLDCTKFFGLLFKLFYPSFHRLFPNSWGDFTQIIYYVSARKGQQQHNLL